MKKNISKKVLAGAMAVAFLGGGLVTYAGTELVWGGEADVAKISEVISTLKSEVFNKSQKLTKGEKALEDMKAESEDLKAQIKSKTEEISAMDGMKSKLEAEINELNSALETQHKLNVENKGIYTEQVAQLKESSDEKVAELESQVKKAQFDKEVLETTITKLNAEKSTLEGKLSGAIEDGQASEDELGKARQDVKGLRDEAEQAIADIQPEMNEK